MTCRHTDTPQSSSQTKRIYPGCPLATPTTRTEALRRCTQSSSCCCRLSLLLVTAGTRHHTHTERCSRTAGAAWLNLGEPATWSWKRASNKASECIWVLLQLGTKGLLQCSGVTASRAQTPPTKGIIDQETSSGFAESPVSPATARAAAAYVVATGNHCCSEQAERVALTQLGKPSGSPQQAHRGKPDTTPWPAAAAAGCAAAGLVLLWAACRHIVVGM